MPLSDFMTPGSGVVGEAAALTRGPSLSEMQFFKSKPEVGGYASPDGKIVLNPFSTLSPQEKQSVMINEFYRLKMRNPMVGQPPRATPGQLKGLAGYGSPQDISQTAIARMLSGDPSAGEPSFAQQGYSNLLRK